MLSVLRVALIVMSLPSTRAVTTTDGKINLKSWSHLLVAAELQVRAAALRERRPGNPGGEGGRGVGDAARRGAPLAR